MTNGHKLNMRKEAKKDMMVKFGKKIQSADSDSQYLIVDSVCIGVSAYEN